MGTRRATMNTLRVAISAAALLATVTATNVHAQVQGKLKPQPAIDLLSQGHLKILTASVWAEPDGLSVSGLVRRAPHWKTGVDGHLDVEAHDPTGLQLGSTSVVWRGSLGMGGHNQPARYTADLPGVSAAQVSRIVVRYIPIAHAAEPKEAAR